MRGIRPFGARSVAICLSSVVLAAFQLMASGDAFADITCSSGTYYRPGQFSANANFSGIYGNITDPVATTLNGDSSNNYHEEHILNWLEMLNERPTGDCGANQSQCWIQAGVGMGSVGWSTTHCYTLARNNTDIYEVYYEAIGAGGESDCHDLFYPNIAINQNASIPAEVYYDGSDGYTGEPQFDAFVTDKNGDPVELRTDELYYSAVHGAAVAEVYSGNTASCPTLTNGSPYQNFGTTYNGTYSANTALQLETGTSWSTWGGSPDLEHHDPYWYTSVHAYSAFQTNGPSSGPAE